MPSLQRNYFFEFAGMPQGGKTTTVRILANYLKMMEYPFEVYHGGSRYSPLFTAPIAGLNLSLACKAVNFTVTALRCEQSENKIYLLNRGLIDRCIFTDTLVCCEKVKKKDAETIKAFLTLPNLLERLDGVFIFIVAPCIALEREYGGKPPELGREVMNEHFLSNMYSIIRNEYSDPQHFYVKNTQIIRTDWEGEQTTCKYIFDNILNIIQTSAKLYEHSISYPSC